MENGLYEEWSKIDATFMQKWQTAIDNYKKDWENYKHNDSITDKPNNKANKYHVLDYTVLLYFIYKYIYNK